MKIRKIVSSFVAFVMVVGLMSGCSSSSDTGSETPEKVIIGTQQMPNDEGIAKALNYFEEEMGVDVELKSFDSGRDVATALMTGDIDFGLLGSCPAALAISQGAEVEYIWTHEVLGSVESLVVKSDITTAADLVGKTIATPFASTAHFSLLKYLEINNIDESEVTLLDMQPAEIYTAWESDQIDAAYIWEPTMSQLSDATKLATSADLADAGYMTANVELVTKSFAEKYPDLVTSYVKALDKATALFLDDEDEAVSTIAKFMELSEEDALFQMSGSIWMRAKDQIGADYMGTSSEKGAIVDNLFDIAEFLLDQGSITEVPEKSVFEDSVNPEYAENVAK